jgi:casein kinase II subunit alpha
MFEDDSSLHAAPRESDFSEPSVVHHRFNSGHPLISPYYANVNLESGPSHWSYHKWNPQFGSISRYSVSRLIGSGRYSDVFLGRADGSRFAIKVLRRVNPNRIRREAKILQCLKGHTNILSLTDIVIDGRASLVSLVTEYVDNVSWTTLVRTMKLEDIRLYSYRLIQGLQFAHERGIVHRDVKPPNVLCDRRGALKIADWGVAEFYHPMRKYSQAAGTLCWQARELLVDFGYYGYPVDVWGAGLILIAALTGRKRVFEGQARDEVLRKIAEVVGGRKIAKWFARYRMQVPQSVSEAFESVKGRGFEPLFGAARRAFRDPDALALAKRMLKIDHKKRISLKEALEHPFFAPLRGLDDNLR